MCRTLVLWIGALTSLLAATCGVFQNDLKRVIAFSTCSQLGYMFVCCGASAYSFAMFHLTTHAFFKALLFLSAGVIIHGAFDVQDTRKLGGYHQLFPWTWFTMLCSSLSLVGWPFLAGFYSKDAVLELCYSLPVYAVMTFVTLLTAYYSLSTLGKVFLSSFSGYRRELPSAGISVTFLLPGLFLSIGSVFLGYAFSEMFIGLGTNFWQSSICTFPGSDLVSGHFCPFPVSWLPFCATFSGLLLSAGFSKAKAIFSVRG
jgi:NADH-ubiquinone oxidoreductase chain 5